MLPSVIRNRSNVFAVLSLLVSVSKICPLDKKMLFFLLGLSRVSVLAGEEVRCRTYAPQSSSLDSLNNSSTKAGC